MHFVNKYLVLFSIYFILSNTFAIALPKNLAKYVFRASCSELYVAPLILNLSSRLMRILRPLFAFLSTIMGLLSHIYSLLFYAAIVAALYSAYQGYQAMAGNRSMADVYTACQDYLTRLKGNITAFYENTIDPILQAINPPLGPAPAPGQPVPPTAAENIRHIVQNLETTAARLREVQSTINNMDVPRFTAFLMWLGIVPRPPAP